MSKFRDHPYVKQMLSLGLPPRDYAITGSGPLFVRGLIEDPHDIDVVARGPAWRRATMHTEPILAQYSTVSHVVLFDGDVEVLNGWFPEKWDVDELIDGADILEEIRFVVIPVIIATKEMLRRPRDLQHLKILKARGW